MISFKKGPFVWYSLIIAPLTCLPAVIPQVAWERQCAPLSSMNPASLSSVWLSLTFPAAAKCPTCSKSTASTVTPSHRWSGRCSAARPMPSKPVRFAPPTPPNQSNNQLHKHCHIAPPLLIVAPPSTLFTVNDPTVSIIVMWDTVCGVHFEVTFAFRIFPYKYTNVQ